MVEKVDTEKGMNRVVFGRDYYGLNVTNYGKVDKIREEGTAVHCYTVKVNQGIEKIEINYTEEKLDDWKVGISRVASGSSNNSLLRPVRAIVAEPGTLLSGSLIKIGSFKTEEEAVNCLRYLKTDFAGFLLGIITPTQDATRKNYRLIPLVDFKTGEVLDRSFTLRWGVSIDQYRERSTLRPSSRADRALTPV